MGEHGEVLTDFFRRELSERGEVRLGVIAWDDDQIAEKLSKSRLVLFPAKLGRDPLEWVVCVILVLVVPEVHHSLVEQEVVKRVDVVLSL